MERAKPTRVPKSEPFQRRGTSTPPPQTFRGVPQAVAGLRAALHLPASADWGAILDWGEVLQAVKGLVGAAGHEQGRTEAVAFGAGPLLAGLLAAPVPPPSPPSPGGALGATRAAALREAMLLLRDLSGGSDLASADRAVGSSELVLNLFALMAHSALFEVFILIQGGKCVYF